MAFKFTVTALVALAIAMPAEANDAVSTNTNTNTNTVTIGAPYKAPVAVKPNVQNPPKPPAKVPVKPAVKTPVKAAIDETNTPVVKNTLSATANPVNNAQVDSKSDSKSDSSATGGAGGSATGGTAAGGVATVSSGDVNLNYSDTQRAAASPTAPSIYPTAECSTAGSASVTAPMFGVALGGTAESVSCNARQNFNAFAASDLPNAAAAAMCLGTPEQRIAIEAEGTDCTVLTKGYVKPVKTGGALGNPDRLAELCANPITDYDVWREIQPLCQR